VVGNQTTTACSCVWGVFLISPPFLFPLLVIAPSSSFPSTVYGFDSERHSASAGNASKHIITSAETLSPPSFSLLPHAHGYLEISCRFRRSSRAA
jgi:hypothetical protein